MRTLSALALLALLAAPASAQDPSGQPANGYVELREGFPNDPYVVDLFAGGPVASRAPGCSVSEVGNVGSSPDFDLHYDGTGGSSLYFYAASGGDTTMLVHAPDGTWWCDDDTNEFDPLVEIGVAESGIYSVWVGAWGDETVEARLYISEIDPR